MPTRAWFVTGRLEAYPTLTLRFFPIGRTPHEEIERVKIEHVKRLLAETDLTLAAIAHRSGYEHVEYMCVAFKRAAGVPPGKYRVEQRG